MAQPKTRAKTGWSRREFLGTAGVAVATIAFPEILIACGSQSSSTPTAAIPKPRKAASIRLLQWTSYVKPADAEFTRHATDWSDSNGVWRAIPYTVVPNAWTYRTDYFQQAGVTSCPTTWDELAAAAAKLKTTGKSISQTDGHAYGDSLTMWNPVLWGYGGKEVNADG